MVLNRRVASPAVVALSLALTVTLSPAVATADGEAWIWYEHRLRVHEAAEGGPPTVDIRVATDLRANNRNGGLDMLFLRVGPLVTVAPWVSLAIHLTTVADRAPDGAFQSQYRPEFDVSLQHRWGDLGLSHRSRFEALLGAPAGLLRYRNFVRADYRLGQLPLGIFAFEEVFFRHRGAAFQENRATAGVRFSLFEGGALDLGYMFRSRREAPGWEHDHIGLLSLVLLSQAERHPPVAPPR
jgi:hypothetical protein